MSEIGAYDLFRPPARQPLTVHRSTIIDSARWSQIRTSRYRQTRAPAPRKPCRSSDRSSYSRRHPRPIERFLAVDFRYKTDILFPADEGSPCEPPYFIDEAGNKRTARLVEARLMLFLVRRLRSNKVVFRAEHDPWRVARRSIFVYPPAVKEFHAQGQ